MSTGALNPDYGDSSAVQITGNFEHDSRPRAPRTYRRDAVNTRGMSKRRTVVSQPLLSMEISFSTVLLRYAFEDTRNRGSQCFPALSFRGSTTPLAGSPDIHRIGSDHQPGREEHGVASCNLR